VLIPACVNFDLEYADEISRPGTSPPQQAFQLVSAGYELLLSATASSRGFPALGSLTRSRGAIAARRRFLWTGLEGSVFLAHALPALLARMAGQLGDEAEDAGHFPTDPEYHLSVRERVADFFPLPSKHKVFLHNCLAEFRVIGKREPREDVVEGKAWGTAYSHALMRGDNPDDDPGMVWEQIRYARDYFINQASLAVTEIVLERRGRGVFKYYEDELVNISTGDSARMRNFRARMLRAWIAGASGYQNYIAMYDTPVLAGSPA
jgi:hypothetical protein